MGTYSGLIETLDNAPRAANYIAEIGDASLENGSKIGLVFDAYDLLQKLCGTSRWMHEAYAAEGYSIHKIERELGKFIDASCIVVHKMKQQQVESRGAPKKEALKTLINHLNGVFEKYFSTQDINCDEVIYLSDEENQDNRKKDHKDQSRVTFIEECLKMAKIDYPDTWQRLLWSNDSTEPHTILRRF